MYAALLLIDVCYCSSLGPADIQNDEQILEIDQAMAELALKLDLLDANTSPTGFCNLPWHLGNIMPNGFDPTSISYRRPEGCIADERFTSSEMTNKFLILPKEYINSFHLPVIIHVNGQRLKLRGGVLSGVTGDKATSFYFIVSQENDRDYFVFSKDGENVGSISPVFKNLALKCNGLGRNELVFPSPEELKCFKSASIGEFQYFIYQHLEKVTCNFDVTNILPLFECMSYDSVFMTGLPAKQGQFLIFLFQLLTLHHLGDKIQDQVVLELQNQMEEASKSPSKKTFTDYASQLSEQLEEFTVVTFPLDKEFFIPVLRWMYLKVPNVFYFLKSENQDLPHVLHMTTLDSILEENTDVSEDIYERLVPILFTDAQIPLSLKISVSLAQDQTILTLVSIITSKGELFLINVNEERVEISLWTCGKNQGTFNFDPSFDEFYLSSQSPVVAIYKNIVPLPKTVKVAPH